MRNFVADFETNNFEDDCRVWLWGITEIGNPFFQSTNTTIDTFIEFCQRFSRKHTMNVYFHNLKFDGQFLLSWLLNNGFQHDKEKNDMTFNTTISRDRRFFKIEIIFKRYNKKFQKVTFYNSVNKIPLKVSQIAKTFELPYEKVDIDFSYSRPVGHVPTDQEVARVINDCKIVAAALKKQFDQGLTGITHSADALLDFKKTLEKGQFELFFPSLSPLLDDRLRAFFRGGYLYVKPEYEQKELGDGIVYDVNSIYPFVMRDFELPYDYPMIFDGEYESDPIYPLYIQAITCNFEIKPGHLPFVINHDHRSGQTTKPMERALGSEQWLYLTNMEMEMFLKHYDVWNIDFHGGYKFKKSKGIFDKYINKWYNIKSNTKDSGMRQLSKLMLNALYGKFAQNPELESLIPELSTDGIVQYKNDEKEFKDPPYMPMAIFITAMARCLTLYFAQENYDRFIFSDTDSIHLLGHEKAKLPIDQNKMGCWKEEEKFTHAKYIAPKLYVHVINDELKIVGAGMTEKIKSQVTFDNFKLNAKYEGKIDLKNVKGGAILIESNYTIRDKKTIFRRF